MEMQSVFLKWVGGKHQTLQKFDLINIWTAVEFRQTGLRQTVHAT